MGARRLPVWPGLLLVGLACVFFAAARCTFFRQAKQTDIDEIAAAVNEHDHAIARYDTRCRPMAVALDAGPCAAYFAALQANERAIGASLTAAALGREDLQLKDLEQSLDNLRAFNSW